MTVILISGKAGHGKDTVADLMKEYLEKNGKTVLIIKFGDAVKWLASKYFGFDGKKDTQGRNILQTLGTEIMRAKYPTYWAELVAKFISACNSWDYVLIPDLRFSNEWTTVKQFNDNVYTVRVDRYDENGQPFVNLKMDAEQRNHISETELDHANFDYWIRNEYGITELAAEAINILNIIQERQKKEIN